MTLNRIAFKTFDDILPSKFPVPNPKLKGRNLFRIALLMAGVLVLTCTLIRPVFAVEGGKGFYLLYSVIAFDLFIRKQFNHIGGA